MWLKMDAALILETCEQQIVLGSFFFWKLYSHTVSDYSNIIVLLSINDGLIKQTYTKTFFFHFRKNILLLSLP
jgi:hypothetical protein